MTKAAVAAGGRHFFVRGLAALIGLTIAVIAITANVAPASAQIYYPGAYDDTPRYKARKRRPVTRPQISRAVPGEPNAGAASKTKGGKQDTKTADKTALKGPLFAVVSLGDQKITVYNHDGIVAQSRVSTGTASHPTPKGVFTILGRSRYHFSNIYSGAPMPFMQRVTWSGVALHQGVVPGYPASHGCIRLPGGFAAHLWGLTKVNERVVIARSDVRPVPISHPALPVPKMQPAASDVVTASMGKSTSVHHLAQIGTAAAAAPETVASAPPAGTALLNPLQYAEQLKGKVSAEASATAKAAQDALAAAASKKAAATKAAAALRLAEMAYEAADKKALAAADAMDKAAPDKKDAAEIVSLNAQSTLSSARMKIESLRTTADAKDAEWAETVGKWREASAAAEAARDASRALSRRASPVSVLVSKKDQKVYVRQGLSPLLDAPATVRDPETPLGTHLYIATAAGEDNTSLKWTSLSMPTAAAEPERQLKNKKQTHRETSPPPQSLSASSAEEALERIEIPAEVRERISELLWTGGSIIISDQPLSSETSDIGTDLVVKVR